MSTATCPCIASLRQICMDTPTTTCDRFPGSVYSVLCYRCVYEKRALPWQAAFALCALQDGRLLWRFPVFRLPCTPAWTNASGELGHRTNLARGSASAARRHEAVGSFPGRRADGARFDLIGAVLSQSLSLFSERYWYLVEGRFYLQIHSSGATVRFFTLACQAREPPAKRPRLSR